eukprot:CFRG6786T1
MDKDVVQNSTSHVKDEENIKKSSQLKVLSIHASEVKSVGIGENDEDNRSQQIQQLQPPQQPQQQPLLQRRNTTALDTQFSEPKQTILTSSGLMSSRSMISTSYALDSESTSVEGDVLRLGLNGVSNDFERRKRLHNASVLSKFSRRSFWIVVAFEVLITLPFTLSLLVVMDVTNAHKEECHPYFALSVSLVVLCGFIHLILALAYITQVYKYRNNTVIKSRGRYFLIQSCTLTICIIIVGTVCSLTYLGVFTGQCIFSFTRWPMWSNYFLMMSYLSLRFFTSMFVAGIISRQRTLYLIFVRNSGGTRVYSKEELDKQYWYTNLFCFLLFLLSELPYIAAIVVIHLGYGNPNTITWGMSGQIVLVLVVTFIASYYAYRTKDVEVVFSDWWANVRFIVIYAVSSTAVSISRSTSGATLAVGILFGTLEMVVVTVYLLDSFTAAIVYLKVGIERTNVPAVPGPSSLRISRYKSLTSVRGNEEKEVTVRSVNNKSDDCDRWKFREHSEEAHVPE